MLSIQLADTAMMWIQAAFVVLVAVGIVAALGRKAYGALAGVILAGLFAGVFVFSPLIFQQASKHVCEQTSTDLGVNAASCGTGSGGGGRVGTTLP